VEKDVVFGLQQGATVLKEINKEMSLESVEKMMDDTADAIAYQQVIVNRLRD
jgi:charged multivesicular body protein 6